MFSLKRKLKPCKQKGYLDNPNLFSLLFAANRRISYVIHKSISCAIEIESIIKKAQQLIKSKITLVGL